MESSTDDRLLPAPSHGGPAVAELEPFGLRAEEILDFSVSTNPYGPAPSVVEAIRRASLATYPDPAATLARRRLAEHLGTDPERLALGNGAADLLWALARTLARPRTKVLVVEPTFSEFRTAAHAAGASVLEWRARPEDGFRLDVPSIINRARATRAEVMYLCAPNVPTGAALTAPELVELAAALAGVEIVLDQSFLLLSELWRDLEVALADNVLSVRSLTKEHNIPGVRVGYVLASEDRLARLERQRPAWSTSAPAQAAAIATCGESRFVGTSRARLLEDCRQLQTSLAALGLQPVPTTANFFLLPVPSGADLRHRLLVRHRILVRDCASFGLPAFIRLSARPAADRDHLLSALREEVSPC